MRLPPKPFGWFRCVIENMWEVLEFLKPTNMQHFGKQRQQTRRLNHHGHQAKVEELARLRKQPKPDSIETRLSSQIGNQLAAPEVAKQATGSLGHWKDLGTIRGVMHTDWG